MIAVCTNTNRPLLCLVNHAGFITTVGCGCRRSAECWRDGYYLECHGDMTSKGATTYDMSPKNWLLRNFRARSLYGMKYPQPQHVEVGASVHLALDELQSRYLALDLASAPRQA